MLIRKLIRMIRQPRLQNAAAIESSNSDKNMLGTTNKKNNKSDAATNFYDPSWGFVISAWLGFGFIMALLRWQPWGSRLMYPALTIAAVSAVHMLDHCFSLSSSEAAEKNEKRNQPAGIKTGTFVILLIMTALSILLLIRPLIYNGKLAAAYISSGFDADKKEELLFDGHKHAYPAYMELVTQLEKTNPKDIALIISGDGYDYPLWKMVRDRLPEARIRHIKADMEQGVVLHAGDYSNPATGISDISSAKAGDPGTMIDRPADCIVCIESGGLQEGMTLDYNGIVYSCGFVANEPEVPAGIFYYDMQKNGQSKETLSAP
ncbi:MAG: hypothetical protein IK078_05120, partial [Lachnospiraceae bacterium]|nr:hypothetical protein [Lachnospiraceae bacterium]